jgi:hypothetical protein
LHWREGWRYGATPDDNLWVPKTPFISCGLGILMDQPAESIQPHDAFAGRWIGFGDGSERWRLTECAVRPRWL